MPLRRDGAGGGRWTGWELAGAGSGCAWLCGLQELRSARHATRRVASARASPFEAWRRPEKWLTGVQAPASRRRRPGAGVLRVAAERLEGEAPVRAREYVHAAVVLRVLDARHHDP